MFLNLRRGITNLDLGDQGRPPIKRGVFTETKKSDEGGVVGRACCV